MAHHFFRATLAIAVGLALAACSGKPAAESSTDKAAPSSASLAVSLVKVEQRRIDRSIIASGPVSAWEEMQLGVELSGVRVTALNVDVGQRVRKGQVLLELDHRTLDSDLRQAQASADEASAGVVLAKTNLARGQALAKSQLISASALDELRAALVQAEARDATSRAQRDGVQLRRDFAALRAPDDGVISKRLVQPGQVVAAGSELLRLIRQGRLEWRAELAESELARVQTGAKVTLKNSDGSVVEGHVRAVSPGVDAGTRTGTVYVDLPAPGALKVGAFIEGRILTSAGNALMLPTAAVVIRDGFPYVFTVDDHDIVHRVRIRTGGNQGDRVEVLEGVVAGDAVVARGAGFLGDGDQVRVVDDAAAGKAGATP